jgi:hypothetical protein
MFFFGETKLFRKRCRLCHDKPSTLMTLGRLHGSYGVCMDRMVFAWIVWCLHGLYGVCMDRMAFACIVWCLHGSYRKCVGPGVNSSHEIILQCTKVDDEAHSSQRCSCCHCDTVNMRCMQRRQRERQRRFTKSTNTTKQIGQDRRSQSSLYSMAWPREGHCWHTWNAQSVMRRLFSRFRSPL